MAQHTGYFAPHSTHLSLLSSLRIERNFGYYVEVSVAHSLDYSLHCGVCSDSLERASRGDIDYDGVLEEVESDSREAEKAPEHSYPHQLAP